MIEDPRGRIEYDERGAGPTVVLVPGSCSTGAAWRPVMAAWADRFRCVTTSLLGYGGLGCGNWSTFSAIERLERDLGKPVLTTNQVSLWHALKMLDAAPLSGSGVLLRQHLGSAPIAKRAAG